MISCKQFSLFSGAGEGGEWGIFEMRVKREKMTSFGFSVRVKITSQFELREAAGC